MDKLLLDADLVQFDPVFSGAVLMGPPPVPIKASGKVTVMGKLICLQGDEKKVQLQIGYIKPPYVIPGMGMLKIIKLAGNQVSKKTVNGKKALLKGSVFDAEFTVLSPAQQPTAAGPVPDAKPKYKGKGKFISLNLKCTSK
ncbi:hypothetical protein HG263_08345 [Pseudoalteromonas sp. JBTF-M23]|uniref:Uncharacterized protein n=1 Tax=Pseudoalteromonas caenipelagi TaxID=2726988 RepID=A0A849VCM8_9GAMM|nr:hypothetical protein [Pseudoalteromonas caenipelagi]NOU50550.1 hypothetical protein [Pseudoalteromonas caenipelagi]